MNAQPSVVTRAALAIVSLWRRELIRFFRQPSRVIGALGSPLVFWALIGSGLSGSFRMPSALEGTAPGSLSDGGGIDYLAYFFPGTVALVVLFAAIFSTISVIEDRNEGFLQGVLVAPVGRGALVGGKILGGGTLAWLQGLALLIVAPLAGLDLSLDMVARTAGVVAMLAIGLTGLGFVFAWKVNSTQGFHAVMNLVLVPLWLLSGALFPIAGAPGWLQVAMRANPLTYGVEALRYALGSGTSVGLPPIALCLTIWCVATGLVCALALVVTRHR